VGKGHKLGERVRHQLTPLPVGEPIKLRARLLIGPPLQARVQDALHLAAEPGALTVPLGKRLDQVNVGVTGVDRDPTLYPFACSSLTAWARVTAKTRARATPT
jgi:hypothetical protein